ncbi:MAG: hypothetical protein AABW59_02820 [archaeon]
MQKRIVLALFVLVSLAGYAAAYEVPLSTFGFGGIELNGPFGEKCQTISIDMADKVTLAEGQGVLSIHATFDKADNDNSYISLSVDGGTEKIIWPERMTCGETCWSRVFLPELSKGITNLNLCLKTGTYTNSAVISENSFIGFYDTPVLWIENRAPTQIFLGQRAMMSIIIKNTGSKDANISAQFVQEDTRSLVEIKSFDIIEGDSSVTTTIKAGETREFFYFIKPSAASSYNLSSAALFFDNVFNERQMIVSNHPQMKVLIPNQIEVSLVGTEERNGVLRLKLIAKNNWDSFYEGKILFSPSDLIFDSNQDISIAPSATQEISVRTKTLTPGSYSFSASVTDSNNSYSTQNIQYDVKREGFPIEIVMAVIAIILATAVILWVYKGKNKN